MNLKTLNQWYENLSDVGPFLVRVIVGIIFIAHGGAKFAGGIGGTAEAFGSLGIPLPVLSAWLAAGTELIGGILLVLGLATRVVAIPLAFTMVVAFAYVHGAHGFFLPQGFEFVLLLFVLNVAIILQGGGRWSLDRVLAARFAPELTRI